MLKQLRRKFVLINMAMVSVVVIAVLTTIGVVSYQQSTNTVFDSIHYSIQNAFRQSIDSDALPFGQRGYFDPPPEGPGHGPDGPGHGPKGEPPADGFFSPHIGGGNNDVIPVAVYEVTTVGSFQMVSRASSAALTETTLTEATLAIKNSSRDEGTLANLGLFYVKETIGYTTYYGFASTSSALDLGGLVGMLVLIGVATLLVFLLLSVLFARWALRPVEESWEAQKQFIADASHELKTPLTVILANTDIMMKRSDKSIASQQQWLESTQREAHSMQEMIVSMLDLARLDASEGLGTNSDAQAARESINLSDAALGEMLQFESIAFEKSILLEDDIDEGLHVMGDPQQVGRLCKTLLDNACKYAPASSVITVNLKAGDASSLKHAPATSLRGAVPKGQAAILSVSNQGEPIAPEDLPHVFDRFYRTDKARTHDASGNNSYGLGLAIAAETAVAHGGCIAVTSAEGTGTTFTIALPLARN